MDRRMDHLHPDIRLLPQEAAQDREVLMIEKVINFHNTNIFRETQISPLSYYTTKKLLLLQFDYLNLLQTKKEKEEKNFFLPPY